MVPFIKAIMPMILISNVNIIYIEIVLSLSIGSMEGNVHFLLYIDIINLFLRSLLNDLILVVDKNIYTFGYALQR